MDVVDIAASMIMSSKILFFPLHAKGASGKEHKFRGFKFRTRYDNMIVSGGSSAAGTGSGHHRYRLRIALISLITVLLSLSCIVMINRFSEAAGDMMGIFNESQHREIFVHPPTSLPATRVCNSFSSSSTSLLQDRIARGGVEVTFDALPNETNDAQQLSDFVHELERWKKYRRWALGGNGDLLKLYQGHDVFSLAGNQSNDDYIREQQEACFSNHSRPFYRVRSAVYPMPDREEASSLLRKQQRRKERSRGRVACLVTGLMRSYQEVYSRLAETVFIPTACDVFISTDALRGFAQLRFSLDEAARPYSGLEHEIAWEIIQTHFNTTAETEQRIRARLQVGDGNKSYDEASYEPEVAGINKGNMGTHVTPFLSVNVAPMPLHAAREYKSLVATRPRTQALPIYRHMLVALHAMLKHEQRTELKYHVLFQLRPDLMFQYPTQFHVVREVDEKSGGEVVTHLVRDGVAVRLSNRTLVVNGRISGPNRANDHLTVGLREPMIHFLQSYYFFKHVATDELHSEVAKKIVLMHWGYTVCGLHLRVESLKHRARGYHGARIHFTNSRFCFRNCSFVAPVHCRASFVTSGGGVDDGHRDLSALVLPQSRKDNCPFYPPSTRC